LLNKQIAGELSTSKITPKMHRGQVMHKMKASSGPPETQQADVLELRAEEALRKSEERWRSVFENSAIGVALTDLNGRFWPPIMSTRNCRVTRRRNCVHFIF
jgi:PAS domain-containing protein